MRLVSNAKVDRAPVLIVQEGGIHRDFEMAVCSSSMADIVRTARRQVLTVLLCLQEHCACIENRTANRKLRFMTG